VSPRLRFTNILTTRRRKHQHLAHPIPNNILFLLLRRLRCCALVDSSPSPSRRSRRFIAFAFAALSSIHRLRLRGCSSPPSLPRVGLPRCHLVASAVASSSPWPPSLAPLSTGSRRCRRCRFVPAAVVSSPPPSFHRRRRRFTINNQLITRGRGLSSEPSSHPSSRPSAT